MMIDILLCIVYGFRIQAEHELGKYNNCLYRYILTLLLTCQLYAHTALSAYKLPGFYAEKRNLMHKV